MEKELEKVFYSDIIFLSHAVSLVISAELTFTSTYCHFDLAAVHRYSTESTPGRLCF